MITLTKAQACAYLVRLHFEYGGKTVREQARRLQSIQFDPLDVVGNNPDLVLQSRVPNYKRELLRKELYETRALVDGFDKMLCVYPVEDYPYLARLRKSTVWWYRENEQLCAAYPRVLREVETRGPLCSDDIDINEKVRWPWGDTKLSRAALESLWMAGELTLHHKKGVRRYYDLSSRLIPESILTAPDPNKTEEAYFAWQAYRRLLSVGLLKNGASDAFLGIENMKAVQRGQAFAALEADGRIVPAAIDGVNAQAYLPAEYLPVLEEAVRDGVPTRARVLAPLDNLLWDRKLIGELFGFEYRWEVYTPKEKRKYGYYVLPVLLGDRFVARFEPRHFRGGELVIENWWWEKDARVTAAARRSVKSGLNRFCRYLGAEGYRIENEWK